MLHAHARCMHIYPRHNFTQKYDMLKLLLLLLESKYYLYFFLKYKIYWYLFIYFEGCHMKTSQRSHPSYHYSHPSTLNFRVLVILIANRECSVWKNLVRVVCTQVLFALGAIFRLSSKGTKGRRPHCFHTRGPRGCAFASWWSIGNLNYHY